jgi:hypothetical protein
MEIILLIIGLIFIFWIIKKLDDSIMYSLASIVGSKKRDVGVVIFWILVIIIGVPILFIFAG